MHKLGIIVPYRNRYEHLAKFHDHLKIYLDKKDINYTLIIKISTLLLAIMVKVCSSIFKHN